MVLELAALHSVGTAIPAALQCAAAEVQYMKTDDVLSGRSPDHSQDPSAHRLDSIRRASDK